MSTHTELTIGGRALAVSNLDKLMYPECGFKKAQVIDYYIRIAPVLLPHLKNRPITLKRYPEGASGPFFYEKQCPAHHPAWVRTATVPGGKRGRIDYCMLNDLPALIWAANLASLELHTFLHRAPAISRPLVIAFDLDPGPPADIVDCCRVALWLKRELDRAGLQSHAKTSGSKGLQLFAPLNTAVDYEDTKSFARALAEMMERDHPAVVVSRMEKKLRTGKVLIDWSQNDAHKTTVGVYSLRAKSQPTVSTPVTWREIGQCCKTKAASRLSFLAEDVLARVDKQGDLFSEILTLKQKLRTPTEHAGDEEPKLSLPRSGRKGVESGS